MLNRLIMGPGDPAENRLEAEVFLSWLRTTFTTFPDQIRWIICGSIGLEPILARHNLSFTGGTSARVSLAALGSPDGRPMPQALG